MPHAGLVTTDTGANVVAAPVQHLRNKLGIGDLPAHDTDSICVAALENGFRRLWLIKTPSHAQWHPDPGLDRRRLRSHKSLTLAHWSNCQ